MRILIPVLIATASVIPFVVLVLYLILRKNPNAPEPIGPTNGAVGVPDVLFEMEDAEFAAAAEAIRERKGNEAAIRELNSTAGVQDEIDWAETDTPYRPGSIEPICLFSMLGLANHPKIVNGEHRVFVDRNALERVQSHLHSDTSVELGGLLIGVPYYAPAVDAYLVVIHDAIEAHEGKETSISFEYTADTWRALTPKLQEMPGEYVVVGSYHSHPGIGVFLSSTDLNTQASVFCQPWQIALVVDPVRNETGFFISPEGVPTPFDLF